MAQVLQILYSGTETQILHVKKFPPFFWEVSVQNNVKNLPHAHVRTHQHRHQHRHNAQLRAHGIKANSLSSLRRNR